MAKIVINPVVGAYASVTAINNRLQQIEDAFNDDILWRGGFVSEPNSMSVDLDMNGQSLLNVDALNSTVVGGGGSVQDGVDWSQEWAINVEDLLISVAAGGNGTTDYSSLHWAAKADASETIATAAKDAIDLAHLGPKATAPTTLNDGTTVLGSAHNGIRYWNTGTTNDWTWDGSSWGLTSTSVATNAVNVSIGDTGGYYAGVNVEAALQELQPQTGTWTPALSGDTTAGTGWVLAAADGTYRVVGGIVYIDFRIQITVIGTGAAGKVVIGGLPSAITATNTSPSSKVVGSIWTRGVTFPTGCTMLGAVGDNSRALNIIGSGSNVAEAFVMITDISNFDFIYGTLTYVAP